MLPYFDIIGRVFYSQFFGIRVVVSSIIYMYGSPGSCAMSILFLKLLLFQLFCVCQRSSQVVFFWFPALFYKLATLKFGGLLESGCKLSLGNPTPSDKRAGGQLIQHGLAGQCSANCLFSSFLHISEFI